MKIRKIELRPGFYLLEEKSLSSMAKGSKQHISNFVIS